jgi:arylsulfatase A-like enzyme
MFRLVGVLLVLALGGCTAGVPQGKAVQSAAQSSRKPNVVLIIADDLGYADLGCQGAKDISTPNIDRLAAGGVRFTDGYVSCPVCSPTRAGINTGRYQQRFGHEFNPGPPAQAGETFGLPLTERTIADYFKSAGYATGLVGKWHLGYRPEYTPTKRGYDEFFGFLGGAHSYLESGKGVDGIFRGTTPVNEKEYLTDALNREAVAFIERHAAEPFFLYLAYNAVHTPNQATDKYLQRFAGIADPLRRTMAAKLAALDDGVGAVLKTLADRGIENDTLIVFISDNGGPTPTNGSRNTPLSGFKGQVWEGGIRVPYLMQFKGRLPAGQIYRQPVISLDILPTALAAAGVPVPADRKLDGVNLLPYLAGQANKPPHEALCWRFGTSWAIRKGEYKLTAQKSEPQLFNLAEDIAEKHDLTADKPDIARQLKADWDRWNAQLAAPLWQGRNSNGVQGTQPARAARRPAANRPQNRAARQARRAARQAQTAPAK